MHARLCKSVLDLTNFCITYMHHKLMYSIYDVGLFYLQMIITTNQTNIRYTVDFCSCIPFGLSNPCIISGVGNLFMFVKVLNQGPTYTHGPGFPNSGALSMRMPGNGCGVPWHVTSTSPRWRCPTRIFERSEEGYGGFLKWWYPANMGFPTKNDHFGVFWGYHHSRNTYI